MSRDEQDHPLISERSPSYARARHEHTHPSPTADPEEIAVLNRLVEAEDHAGAVCAAAIVALGSGSAPGSAPGRAQGARAPADVVAELGALHEGQVHALARVIADLGAAAPQPDQRERVLTRDPADIHYLQDPAAILQALDATEDELGARYADARARPRMPAAAHAVLQRHGEAQRDHRAQLTALMRGATRF